MDMTYLQRTSRIFVFVDETGTDRRDSMRKFGYSLRGKPPVSQKLLFRGQQVSTIAAISFDQGLLYCYTVTGTVSGEQLGDFIQNSLLPHLQVFDGVNSRSVVVLDNASIHHIDGIADSIQSTELWYIFYPPTVLTSIL